MKKKVLVIGILCMAVLGLGLTAAAASKIVRSSMNSYEIIQCKGRPVEISGTSNQFELYGDCPSLTIHGSENTVKVERVGRIRIEGTDNQVIWSRALAGAAPKSSTAGTGNKIVKGKMETKAAVGNGAVDGRSKAVKANSADLKVAIAGRDEAVEVNRTGVKAAGRDGAVEVGRAGVKVESRDGVVELRRAGAKAEDRDEAVEERHADAGPDNADPEEAVDSDRPRHREERRGPARKIEINGVGKERSVTCHGEDVEVGGNNNHVRVKGECRKVTVEGNGNVCRVEAVGIISVSGNDNEVAWKRALGGEEPRIEEQGNDNKIREIEGRF